MRQILTLMSQINAFVWFRLLLVLFRALQALAKKESQVLLDHLAPKALEDPHTIL